MRLSIFIVLAAALYWYVTGHAVPALLGFALAFMVEESLRLVAAVFSALILGFCLYYLTAALPDMVAQKNTLHLPVGFAYMVAVSIRAYFTVN